MYVKPHLRSNYIGNVIIENIKLIGKQRQWKRIDVTTPNEKKWKRTITFYEKCGFVFTGSKLKLNI